MATKKTLVWNTEESEVNEREREKEKENELNEPVFVCVFFFIITTNEKRVS